MKSVIFAATVGMSIIMPSIVAAQTTVIHAGRLIDVPGEAPRGASTIDMQLAALLDARLKPAGPRNLQTKGRQIAAASEQQSSVAEEMSGNLEQVKQVVEGSVVVLRELQEASELVEHHSQTLDTHIQAFKLA